MNLKIGLVSTLIACILLSGCGGESPLQESPKGGEGSIPIGRAPNEGLQGGRVVIVKSNGAKFETQLRDGVIYSDQLPTGETRIELYPNNKNFNRQAVVFNAGAEQNYVTNMWPLPRTLFIKIFDITLNVAEGQVIHIGDTVSLNVAVKALSSAAINPTVTVSGGVGSLDVLNNFVATSPGHGQIIVTVLGRTKTVSFEVQ